jgi:hypothetical protein
MSVNPADLFNVDLSMIQSADVGGGQPFLLGEYQCDDDEPEDDDESNS